LSGHRFVGFLQNHDQVGNRPKGDRASQFLNIRRLKIGCTLVLCAPFVPMLFQGEEFGTSAPFLYFTDHRDPELADAVSRGRREEFASFGWNPEEVPDPQDPCSFESSKLDWLRIQGHAHAELHRWYSRVISLRRTTSALMNGSLNNVQVEFSESDSWLILYRQSVAVICNLAIRRLAVTLRFSARALLASDSSFALHGNAVEVPVESVLIVEDARLCTRVQSVEEHFL